VKGEVTRGGGTLSCTGDPPFRATQKSTIILPARFVRISEFHSKNKFAAIPVEIIYSKPNLRVMTLSLNDIYQKSELKRPFSFKESKATERSQIEVGGCEIQLELG